MELMIVALYGLMIPQVVAGLIGGLLGSLISIKVELYGWRLSILFGIGSILCAGALSEYLTITYAIKFILLHGVLGLLVGILGNAAIDALNLASVDFTRKLVNILSNGILEIVKELPKLIIKKLEDGFNWLKIFTRKDKNE